MKDAITVVSGMIYWICKIYFMLMGLYYIWALFNGRVDAFANVTGIVGLAFLVSNVWWYFFK